MDDTTTATGPQVAADLRTVIARLIRRLREAGAGDDITPPQASALARIGKAGASTTSALARTEKVRPQSMAATVAALEHHGLVTRNPDPTDGRRQIISLTEAGQERFDGQRGAGPAWLEDTLTTRLTPEQLRTLAAATAILDEVLD
jgi:DNA-binding MarR family transcriptional regulator